MQDKEQATATTELFSECAESFRKDFCPYQGAPDPWIVWQAAWKAAMHAFNGQAPAGLAVPSMSADEVNALPTAARAYIHQLVANTDPAGMVRENMQLRDTNAGLQSMYRKAADAAQEVVGCFHAAECEGLQAALAETADEHLKDLVERRLMHALYAAQEVAGQAPAQEGKSHDYS